MRIGSKIKEYREKSNISQKQLAAMLNLTPQAVSKWENDGSLPDITMLPRIHQILRIPYYVIFGEEEQEKYTKQEKKLFLEKCLSVASEANELCKLLDGWSRMQSEQHDKVIKEHPELNKTVISICDIDILYPLEWQREYEKKRSVEYKNFLDIVGEETMSYIMMILYLGKDVSDDVWELPKETEDDYSESVCNLLLTDKDDYYALRDSYYDLKEKRPELVSKWIRRALEVIIKAV